MKTGSGTCATNERGIDLRELVLDSAGHLSLSGRTQRGEQGVTIGKMTICRVGSDTNASGHFTDGDGIRTVLTSQFEARLNKSLTQVAMVIGIACANRNFIHGVTLYMLRRLVRSGRETISCV